MVQQIEKIATNPELKIDVSELVTEDDTPVDFGCEKQQRFLTSALYSAKKGEKFLIEANVGIYYQLNKPPVVPDVFLSLDVETPENWWEKSHRCYLTWEFGKVPEVVIEIVSNKVGEELGEKLEIYQRMRVIYYVVYDPGKNLGESLLHIYELKGREYFKTTETWLEQVNLGLTLWEGEFEGRKDLWLRWCDKEGNILLTGDEKAAQESLEKQEQRQRATEAEQRAQLLAEKLREMGVDPDNL